MRQACIATAAAGAVPITSTDTARHYFAAGETAFM